MVGPFFIQSARKQTRATAIGVHDPDGRGAAGFRPAKDDLPAIWRFTRAEVPPLAARSGSVSAEHGIGLEKQPWLALSRSEAELDVMRRLKAMLDPRGILNPGRVLTA